MMKVNFPFLSGTLKNLYLKDAKHSSLCFCAIKSNATVYSLILLILSLHSSFLIFELYCGILIAATITPCFSFPRENHLTLSPNAGWFSIMYSFFSCYSYLIFFELSNILLKIEFKYLDLEDL